ncbi:hypothetical protein K2173_016098 [Erythroxylum novogranatense]|uniref:Uncharacterized protein n=1 Tax=Erythroxylum novogranatense TaxID=1862640 RepID=A0AAV8SFF6_9ROSI|nr:hypothetical protein K2173_016098 [Erythroxylum novogranatense]
MISLPTDDSNPVTRSLHGFGTGIFCVNHLGFVEKNILNCDFDLVLSDPSDANTNNTTLFSDDTDDKSRRSTNSEIELSAHQEDEIRSLEAVHKIVEEFPSTQQLNGLGADMDTVLLRI